MSQLTTASSGLGVQKDSDVRPGKPPRIRAEAANAESYIIYLRAKWMREMGATAEDISEFCNLARHPGSVVEEEENVRALEELQTKNVSRVDLEKMAKRFGEPPAR